MTLGPKRGAIGPLAPVLWPIASRGGEAMGAWHSRKPGAPVMPPALVLALSAPVPAR